MFLILRTPRLNNFWFVSYLVLLVAFVTIAIGGRGFSLLGSAHTHIAVSNHGATQEQAYGSANERHVRSRPSHVRGHEQRHEYAMQLQSAHAANAITANGRAKQHDHGFVALHQHASDITAKWLNETAHAASTVIDQDNENTAFNFIALPSYWVGLTGIKLLQNLISHAFKSPTSAINKRIERPPMNRYL